MSDINEENIPKRILNLLKDDIAPEVCASRGGLGDVNEPGFSFNFTGIAHGV